MPSRLFTDSRSLRPRHSIQRTPYPPTTTLYHMGIDHRRLHILVAEQFLHRADIVPVFQEMRSKAMSKRMASHLLMDACPARRIAYGALDIVFAQVVASNLSVTRIA